MPEKDFIIWLDKQTCIKVSATREERTDVSLTTNTNCVMLQA